MTKRPCSTHGKATSIGGANLALEHGTGIRSGAVRGDASNSEHVGLYRVLFTYCSPIKNPIIS